MKTMTCQELGGPCDHLVQGQTADEVIKAQDKHLEDAITAGDQTHADAASAMKGRWKHPIASMSWYKGVKRDFAALPES